MPKMAMGKCQVHFMRVLRDAPAKTLTFTVLRSDVYFWNEQRVRRTLKALTPVFIMHNTVRDTYTLLPAGVAMIQEITCPSTRSNASAARTGGKSSRR